MFGLEDDLYSKIEKLTTKGDALALWICDNYDKIQELKDMNSHESKMLHKLLKDWGDAKRFSPWMYKEGQQEKFKTL